MLKKLSKTLSQKGIKMTIKTKNFIAQKGQEYEGLEDYYTIVQKDNPADILVIKEGDIKEIEFIFKKIKEAK